MLKLDIFRSVYPEIQRVLKEHHHYNSVEKLKLKMFGWIKAEGTWIFHKFSIANFVWIPLDFMYHICIYFYQFQQIGISSEKFQSIVCNIILKYIKYIFEGCLTFLSITLALLNRFFPFSIQNIWGNLNSLVHFSRAPIVPKTDGQT